MNNKLSICILLCLVMLASGLAEAQGTYGTKVQAGDPDIGLPLSNFDLLVGVPPQINSWIAYWDIGTTPGFYDEQDVAYLQFGSVFFLKNVNANNIRLTGWGNYAAGSYVNPGDSDIGQPLIPLPVPLPIGSGFYYMNVAGGPGYDINDPVYLDTQAPTGITGTNDIRITPNGIFPAGSRVSLSDPDAARPLTPFYIAYTPAGGPLATSPPPGTTSVAQIAFYNANGNVIRVPPGPNSRAIYDTGDVVYFDIPPLNVVSPNDIRLF